MGISKVSDTNATLCFEILFFFFYYKLKYSNFTFTRFKEKIANDDDTVAMVDIIDGTLAACYS